ncbi:hypothetical protein C8J56DRAFT_881805 [Mycena floridula]|nr:hypothetical protein C8J56DRAFT_881805 [Mycena floridula]
MANPAVLMSVPRCSPFSLFLISAAMLTFTFSSWKCRNYCWGAGTSQICRFWNLQGIYTVLTIYIQSHSLQAHVFLWLLPSSVADLAITLILVWHLVSTICLLYQITRTHKTGFEGSDELVDSIIRITIQTGLVTTWPTSHLQPLSVQTPRWMALFEQIRLAPWSLDCRGIFSKKGTALRMGRTTRPEVFVCVEAREMLDHEPEINSRYTANESHKEDRDEDIWDEPGKGQKEIV